MFEITFEELATAAWGVVKNGRNYVMLEDFVDQAAYNHMIVNYTMMDCQKISRDAAKEIHEQIKNIFHTERHMRDYERNLAFDRAETIKRTEAARNAYRKNRTLENADKLLEAFDGIKAGGEDATK